MPKFINRQFCKGATGHRDRWADYWTNSAQKQSQWWRVNLKEIIDDGLGSFREGSSGLKSKLKLKYLKLRRGWSLTLIKCPTIIITKKFITILIIGTTA